MVEQNEADLRARIAVLTGENAALAERAEETLLLGLVAETAESITGESKLIDHVLERIAILKAVPFCLCGRMTGARIEILNSFLLSGTDDLAGMGFDLPGPILSELENGVFLGPWEQMAPGLGSLLQVNEDFLPRHVAILPFASIPIPNGVLVFASEDMGAERLASMIPLLHRLADLVISKLDFITVFTELRELNRELDEKVADRTSELEAANRRLSESESRLRGLIEATVDFVWEVDLESRFTYLNPQVTRILGYTPAELEGQRPWDTMVEDDAAALAAGVENPELHGEVVHDISSTHIHRDGHKVQLETNRAPFFDSKGELAGYRGISRDVSRRLAADAEREILEKQLQQSQKLQAVGTLAGGVAHDFNNRLQVILGNTQLLKLDWSQKDEDLELLNEIEKVTFGAVDLVRQLLTFSRRTVSDFRDVDLNEEILKSVNLVRRMIPREIDITLDLADDLPWISADPAQIDQLVVNIVNNANQAMPGGGALRISTKVVDAGPGRGTETEVSPSQIHLSISDTGCGMDENVRQKVFEPFFTTKTVGQGTGLGLSNVYGIVTNHRGQIHCESEVGRGTTFDILLPAVEKGSKQIAQQSRSAEMIAFSGEGKCILVVDDEPTVRNVCQKMLERGGYSVLAAIDGETALDVYAEKSEQIDAVILDLSMPGMGGKACLQKLLALDPEVCVIIASGYAMGGMENPDDLNGATGFINKPYEMKDILKQLKSLLD